MNENKCDPAKSAKIVAGLMLGQRHGNWTNIIMTLGQLILFAHRIP